MRSSNKLFLRIALFSFAVLISSATATSLLMAKKVDNAAAIGALHAEAVSSGSESISLERRVISGLVNEIKGLQLITYGLVGGAFASLFET